MFLHEYILACEISKVRTFALRYLVWPDWVIPSIPDLSHMKWTLYYNVIVMAYSEKPDRKLTINWFLWRANPILNTSCDKSSIEKYIKINCLFTVNN